LTTRADQARESNRQRFRLRALNVAGRDGMAIALTPDRPGLRFKARALKC
jgi:hypothetical protein